MNRLSLHELQSIEFDILRIVVGMCDKHDLTYYLVAGTLLGAVRHSGFIPWDDDIVLMARLKWT
jgi:lipopolysaccharide cholinephosphotransferase